MKRPVPYEDWTNSIRAVAAMDEAERQQHPCLLAAMEIDAKVDEFKAKAIPFVSSFLPGDFELKINLACLSDGVYGCLPHDD